MTATTTIVDDARVAPPDWDVRAVHAPGGHVLQSSTWADYRSRTGEEWHYLTFDDDAVALASMRRSTGLPGAEATVRRGPAHRDATTDARVARAVALSAWARDHSARDLYMDPEHDADRAYGPAMEAAGYAVADEREPSIHVMRRTFEPDLDEDGLFRSLSKSTRQRIRSAQDAGTTVRETTDPERMEEFAGLLRARADVLGMNLQSGTDYLDGWTRFIEAGLGRLLLAEHGGEIIGGLFLYRQGGIHATAYSADRVERRRELPGTMHLVRWVAVSEALSEGCPAIELGGVDLPDHREPPEHGEPNRGLYEHKRGFGATWVQREPARRIVLRPRAESVARFRRRTVDALRGMRR